MSLYLVTAIVIYVYVGPDVPSPALSAAGSSIVRKVIWGIAIPSTSAIVLRPRVLKWSPY